jgi:hypothetical protein
MNMAQTPFFGVPPLGMHPAEAMGLNTQMTPGIAGHAVSPVAFILLSQLGLREAISRIGDEALKQRVTTSINESIDRTIEGVSVLTLLPWFGPGAQSVIYSIAAQLALVANRYPEGALRDALLTIAGQIVQKSTAAPSGESTGHRK